MPNKNKGKSSADYYKENPSTAAKKREYQKEYNKKPEEVKKRVELNKKNRESGKVGDKKDYDHATGRMVDQSINRGRTGKNGTPASSGDKRARGGKKK